MNKYNHQIEFHNDVDPSYLVPLFYNLFKPKSVIDVGCGIGNFLKFFKEVGVSDVLGIDGDWVNKEMLYNNIKSNEFKLVNLNEAFTINKKFDLAISLEVAEHLNPSSADTYIHSLTQMSDIIIFSAAIPLQGGQYHYNEQWLSYWKEKFENNGFALFDIIRPEIWTNSNIFWWYRQNIAVFIKKNSKAFTSNFETNPQGCIDYVHPENYYNKTSLLIKILNGEQSLRFYLSLLKKCLLKRYLSK